MRMKYEADVIDWLDEGEARGIIKGRAEELVEGEKRGIELGRENERLIIRRIFELAREGKSIDAIASDINMPKEYVEETLDMVMAK